MYLYLFDKFFKRFTSSPEAEGLVIPSPTLILDPEIFAIAEANHEKYVLDRNEYEARVVLDGLQIFQEEYNKHHEKSYASEQTKKREARLTEEEKAIRAIKNRKYQQNQVSPMSFFTQK